MNEQDFTLLNDYFNELLTPSDAQQVRERAATEAVFGQEFALRQEMEAFPSRAKRRQGFTDTLVAVETEFFQENTATNTKIGSAMTAKVNWGRRLAIAASVVLVIGALWFFNKASAPEYRQYAQHDPLSITVRGVTDQDKSVAEKAFAAKDYPIALAAIERLLSADPGNITAQLYKGICQLELDQPANARGTWAPISSGASALRSEADWYIALSYLKEKNFSACKTALQKIESGADRYKDGQDLLKKLQ